MSRVLRGLGLNNHSQSGVRPSELPPSSVTQFTLNPGLVLYHLAQEINNMAVMTTRIHTECGWLPCGLHKKPLPTPSRSCLQICPRHCLFPYTHKENESHSPQLPVTTCVGQHARIVTQTTILDQRLQSVPRVQQIVCPDWERNRGKSFQFPFQERDVNR